MTIHKRKLIHNVEKIKKRSNYQPFVFGKPVLLWIFMGLLGGSIAGGYWILLEHLTHFMAQFQGWFVIPLMAISGLVAGLIIHFIGDPGELKLIVNNIRFNRGRLEPKNNPSMFLSSLLCISSGGSLGPEAPLVQITGSTGSLLGKILRLKGENFRSLTIAGMASGFTALFGAPLGGSLFSLEILHHKHVVEYYEAILPALVASSASYVVFALIVHLGFGPVWNFPYYHLESMFDFLYAVLFALVAVVVGWCFIYLAKSLQFFWKKTKLPIYAKMFLGGLILGIIAYYLPLTRYFGHEEINTILTGEYTISFLVLLLIFKIFSILITVTSGWRGGFIIPLFLVGTVLGSLLHHLFPEINLSLATISCMAALNACVTRTPLSTAILLSSMTGFHYFVPITFASLTGYFFSPNDPFISTQKTQEGL
ncbi:chloride channel protein [Leptospira idonii]|uniref:Chloride channel protein n=2 Tax=Leptospira idonii TaxID=1193500 RepID=A0A4R9LUH0_9LEPT|nr:chloride channel protein [Leptospira idonii]TGN17392.1 chloride channel protein [Leptospira idonii]